MKAGKDRLTSGELFKGGQTYFWRILGAMVLTAIGIAVLFAVLSACLSLAGLVTFGIGALIGQILLFPITLFFYALSEQSQAAVVADEMSPGDAISHGWKLVNENLEILAVLTLVLYSSFSLISSFVMALVMLLVVLAVLSKFTNEFSDPSFTWIAIVFFVLFLPFYLLIQAGTLLYTKSAFMLNYLRLRRTPKLQSLPG